MERRLRLIGRIKQLTDSVGAQFLLSTYPWAHQVNNADWVPGRYDYIGKDERTSELTQQTIKQRSADLGIELFEALPGFQKHQGETGLYFAYDPHWTPAGQKIMAEALSGFIGAHQLPTWCSSK